MRALERSTCESGVGLAWGGHLVLPRPSRACGARVPTRAVRSMKPRNGCPTHCLCGGISARERTYRDSLVAARYRQRARAWRLRRYSEWKSIIGTHSTHYWGTPAYNPGIQLSEIRGAKTGAEK